jgi:hypothetical protein
VLEKAESEERRKKRAKAMSIREFVPELAVLRTFYESQLRAALQEADDREYLIVCTREYVDSGLIPVGRANVARELSLLNVPAMDIFQNPVAMMRMLGWSVVGISELLYLTVPAQLVLVSEEAAAAVVATVGPTLIKVPEAIIKGVKVANDIVPLKAASGILFVIGIAKEANAQAATIPMDRLGTVRAIPLHSTWELGTLGTGVALDWAGTQYFYLGRASSPL